MARANDVSAARLAAFEVLRQVENGGLSSVLLAAREPELSLNDRALCHELVMGVLRWQALLDRLIQHYSNRNLARLDKDVVLSLRLGLYQLRFLSRIPPSAAVNESVKIVGQANLRSAQSFVNAVLRRATRETEYDPASKIQDPLERAAMQTSHPLWLITRWAKVFGEDKALRIAEANTLTPAISFRVVHSKASESEVLKKLEDARATVTASQLTPHAWRVGNAASVLQELATSGDLYLQDEASQLIAHILNPKAGERILDLCAAPGGKTTQISDLVGDRALIVACDRSATRLQTMARMIDRQDLQGVRMVMLDAEHSLPFFDRAFDRVLVDAPCTGTGTLRRNPEIRWRITAGDIGRMSHRQESILQNAASLVKPGGRLLYSTCSLEPEENEDIVRTFLERNEAFRTVPVGVASWLQTAPGFVRTWPDLQGTDGFFMALLERQV